MTASYKTNLFRDVVETPVEVHEFQGSITQESRKSPSITQLCMSKGGFAHSSFDGDVIACLSKPKGDWTLMVWNKYPYFENKPDYTVDFKEIRDSVYGIFVSDDGNVIAVVYSTFVEPSNAVRVKAFHKDSSKEFFFVERKTMFFKSVNNVALSKDGSTLTFYEYESREPEKPDIMYIATYDLKESKLKEDMIVDDYTNVLDLSYHGEMLNYGSYGYHLDKWTGNWSTIVKKVFSDPVVCSSIDANGNQIVVRGLDDSYVEYYDNKFDMKWSQTYQNETTQSCSIDRSGSFIIMSSSRKKPNDISRSIIRVFSKSGKMLGKSEVLDGSYFCLDSWQKEKQLYVVVGGGIDYWPKIHIVGELYLFVQKLE